ncbi:MAG: alpha/beta hydrolase [Phototrophicales bacterium]|nr:alpha/beta hydrolase [Phototrophicales bacterium]
MTTTSQLPIMVDNSHISKSNQQPAKSFITQFLRAILKAIVTLIALISLLLLAIATSVPLAISILLVVMTLGMVVMLFVLDGKLPVIPLALTGIIIIFILGVIASQQFAYTPAIRDTQGNIIPNSIASLEQVTLGGDAQWVTIRGNNQNNPVLLFLAGGPGGGEMAWTRSVLGGLEEHFVVVNWDQPGVGKSYSTVDIASLTPQRFVSDAYELTEYLCERFNQEKIYVLGESWGTILGIWLVQDHPERFHAYIGSAQMVNTTEDDIRGYEFALAYLEEQGDTTALESIRKNGAPPYIGDGILWTYASYLNVINGYMYAHANGEGQGDNRLFDTFLGPEYGFIDKINWVRGLNDVFNIIYPQIADLDFITQASQLDVPVYFIEGRWDMNAMTVFVEQYYDILQAPHKQLIWFENSGHTPLYEEPNRFVDVMVNVVLAQTQPNS